MSKLLALTKTPTTLSWDSQALTSGSGTLYDVVSGNLLTPASAAFSVVSCLQSSTATNFSDVRPAPAAGTGFWYLVRARNSCGTGSYGSAERDAAIPVCP